MVGKEQISFHEERPNRPEAVRVISRFPGLSSNIVPLIITGGVIAFFTLGIRDEYFWGRTYLDKSLFKAVVQGMFWPYLVLIWPALLISLGLGIYSGLQAGYIKNRPAEKLASFFWDKLNELIDSFPRFVIILFLVFFIGGDNDYYQLILLTVVGLLFVPVVHFHFKKRVQWLAAQHFIDADAEALDGVAVVL
ncbi:MAG: hypothetical protein ACE5GM_06855, partial [bacterium]